MRDMPEQFGASPDLSIEHLLDLLGDPGGGFGRGLLGAVRCLLGKFGSLSESLARGRAHGAVRVAVSFEAASFVGESISAGHDVLRREAHRQGYGLVPDSLFISFRA